MAYIPDFTEGIEGKVTLDLEMYWRNTFAGIALDRLLERETAWPACGTNPNEVAHQATVYADALIEKLNEEKAK